ncbi:UNVERIFIED_CONTAM: hypothetical protein FKN15_075640 [Acipenser sinensis]
MRTEAPKYQGLSVHRGECLPGSSTAAAHQGPAQSPAPHSVQEEQVAIEEQSQEEVVPKEEHCVEQQEEEEEPAEVQVPQEDQPGTLPPELPVRQSAREPWETCADSSVVFIVLRGGQQPVNIRLSGMAVTRRGRGRQPIDIRLSVMAVTRRAVVSSESEVEELMCH